MSESVSVPIHTLPDGRAFIAAKDAVESPEVLAFVHRHSNYWSPADLALDGWVSPNE